MLSAAEGNALCDALNANCQAIAQAQKESDNDKLVNLCRALFGVKRDLARAKASVRPFALAARDEIGTKVRVALYCGVLSVELLVCLSTIRTDNRFVGSLHTCGA